MAYSTPKKAFLKPTVDHPTTAIVGVPRESPMINVGYQVYEPSQNLASYYTHYVPHPFLVLPLSPPLPPPPPMPLQWRNHVRPLKPPVTPLPPRPPELPAEGDELPMAKMTIRGSAVRMRDFFKSKWSVLIGSPGAFNSECSTSFLPGFRDHAPVLRARVDFIGCICINDRTVLRAWARSLHIYRELTFLSDANGQLSSMLGLTKPTPGPPTCRRFAMVITPEAKIAWVRVEKQCLAEDVCKFLGFAPLRAGVSSVVDRQSPITTVATGIRDGSVQSVQRRPPTTPIERGMPQESSSTSREAVDVRCQSECHLLMETVMQENFKRMIELGNSRRFLECGGDLEGVDGIDHPLSDASILEGFNLLSSSEDESCFVFGKTPTITSSQQPMERSGTRRNMKQTSTMREEYLKLQKQQVMPEVMTKISSMLIATSARSSKEVLQISTPMSTSAPEDSPERLDIDYTFVPAQYIVIHTKGVLQVECGATTDGQCFGTVMMQGKIYRANRFHFWLATHRPGESIRPLELRIVHPAADFHHLVVLCVGFERHPYDEDDEFLKTVLGIPTLDPAVLESFSVGFRSIPGNRFPLDLLFKPDAEFLKYNSVVGGYSTAVTWLVAKEPAYASLNQILKIQSMLMYDDKEHYQTPLDLVTIGYAKPIINEIKPVDVEEWGPPQLLHAVKKVVAQVRTIYDVSLPAFEAFLEESRRLNNSTYSGEEIATVLNALSNFFHRMGTEGHLLGHIAMKVAERFPACNDKLQSMKCTSEFSEVAKMYSGYLWTPSQNEEWRSWVDERLKGYPCGTVLKDGSVPPSQLHQQMIECLWIIYAGMKYAPELRTRISSSIFNGSPPIPLPTPRQSSTCVGESTAVVQPTVPEKEELPRLPSSEAEKTDDASDSTSSTQHDSARRSDGESEQEEDYEKSLLRSYETNQPIKAPKNMTKAQVDLALFMLKQLGQTAASESAALSVDSTTAMNTSQNKTTAVIDYVAPTKQRPSARKAIRFAAEAEVQLLESLTRSFSSISDLDEWNDPTRRKQRRQRINRRKQTSFSASSTEMRNMLSTISTLVSSDFDESKSELDGGSSENLVPSESDQSYQSEDLVMSDLSSSSEDRTEWNRRQGKQSADDAMQKNTRAKLTTFGDDSEENHTGDEGKRNSSCAKVQRLNLDGLTKRHDKKPTPKFADVPEEDESGDDEWVDELRTLDRSERIRQRIPTGHPLMGKSLLESEQQDQRPRSRTTFVETAENIDSEGDLWNGASRKQQRRDRIRNRLPTGHPNMSRGLAQTSMDSAVMESSVEEQPMRKRAGKPVFVQTTLDDEKGDSQWHHEERQRERAARIRNRLPTGRPNQSKELLMHSASEESNEEIGRTKKASRTTFLDPSVENYSDEEGWNAKYRHEERATRIRKRVPTAHPNTAKKEQLTTKHSAATLQNRSEPPYSEHLTKKKQEAKSLDVPKKKPSGHPRGQKMTDKTNTVQLECEPVQPPQRRAPTFQEVPLDDVEGDTDWNKKERKESRFSRIRSRAPTGHPNAVKNMQAAKNMKQKLNNKAAKFATLPDEDLSGDDDWDAEDRQQQRFSRIRNRVPTGHPNMARKLQGGAETGVHEEKQEYTERQELKFTELPSNDGLGDNWSEADRKEERSKRLRNRIPTGHPGMARKLLQSKMTTSEDEEEDEDEDDKLGLESNEAPTNDAIDSKWSDPNRDDGDVKKHATSRAVQQKDMDAESTKNAKKSRLKFTEVQGTNDDNEWNDQSRKDERSKRVRSRVPTGHPKLLQSRANHSGADNGWDDPQRREESSGHVRSCVPNMAKDPSGKINRHKLKLGEEPENDETDDPCPKEERSKRVRNHVPTGHPGMAKKRLQSRVEADEGECIAESQKSGLKFESPVDDDADSRWNEEGRREERSKRVRNRVPTGYPSLARRLLEKNNESKLQEKNNEPKLQFDETPMNDNDNEWNDRKEERSKRIRKRIPTGHPGMAKKLLHATGQISEDEDMEKTRQSALRFEDAPNNESNSKWNDPGRKEARSKRVRNRIPTGHPGMARRLLQSKVEESEEDEDLENVITASLKLKRTSARDDPRGNTSDLDERRESSKNCRKHVPASSSTKKPQSRSSTNADGKRENKRCEVQMGEDSKNGSDDRRSEDNQNEGSPPNFSEEGHSIGLHFSETPLNEVAEQHLEDRMDTQTTDPSNDRQKPARNIELTPSDSGKESELQPNVPKLGANSVVNLEDCAGNDQHATDNSGSAMRHPQVLCPSPVDPVDATSGPLHAVPMKISRSFEAYSQREEVTLEQSASTDGRLEAESQQDSFTQDKISPNRCTVRTNFNEKSTNNANGFTRSRGRTASMKTPNKSTEKSLMELTVSLGLL